MYDRAHNNDDDKTAPLMKMKPRTHNDDKTAHENENETAHTQ